MLHDFELDHGRLTFLSIQTVSEQRIASLAVLCDLFISVLCDILLEVLVMLVDDMESSHPTKTYNQKHQLTSTSPRVYMATD